MEGALISVSISAVLLCTLVALFTIEERRGKRFLENVRAFFDHLVLSVMLLFRRMLSLLERTSVRQTFHYCLHNLLETLLGVLRFFESRTLFLVRTNKAAARKIARRNPQRTKLDELEAHKEATALSPLARRTHKERAIGMKLN